jgi:hypothetical protein
LLSCIFIKRLTLLILLEVMLYQQLLGWTIEGEQD